MKHYIVVGLGFGDEGKGTIVDALTNKYNPESIIRFSGGSQAAHNVITEHGVHHTFAQFGSGTLTSPFVKTILTRHCIPNPTSLLFEAKVLQSKRIESQLDRLFISEACLMTLPHHVALSKLRVFTFPTRNSCGCGVGTTIKAHDNGRSQLSIQFEDLKDPTTFRQKLETLHQMSLPELPSDKVCKEIDIIMELAKEPVVGLCDHLIKAYETGLLQLYYGDDHMINPHSIIIYEGTQGALLDTDKGFLPHVTSTRTTSSDATTLEARNNKDNHTTIGVTRGYMTRHGMGLFPTEDKKLRIPELHNKRNCWQGPLRFGWIDCVALRYAININTGIDFLAITNLDSMNFLPKVKICTEYEYIGDACHLDSYYFDWYTKNGRHFISNIRASDQNVLSHCVPVYWEVEGWEKHTDLACQNYVRWISQMLNVPVGITSFGPRTDQKIFNF